MTRRSVSVARLLVLVALVLLGAAACSDDNGDGGAVSSDSTASTTTRPSTTTTTTDPTAALEAEISEAYEASSRAFIDAAAIPDPNLAALVATHTGPMYEQRRGVLLALQADGRVIRYPENSQYRVEVDEDSFEVDGDVARFQICGVDDGERVVAATGEVVAGGVVTVEARVAMQRVDGVWKLAERQQLAEWEGVAGCAVE